MYIIDYMIFDMIEIKQRCFISFSTYQGILLDVFINEEIYGKILEIIDHRLHIIEIHQNLRDYTI